MKVKHCVSISGSPPFSLGRKLGLQLQGLRPKARSFSVRDWQISAVLCKEGSVLSGYQKVSQKMESLTPQAFASNHLNRSMTDRREPGFLRSAFLGNARYLIVSEGRALVYKGPKPSLRWFQTFELQNLAYSMGEAGLEREEGGTIPDPYSF